MSVAQKPKNRENIRLGSVTASTGMKTERTHRAPPFIFLIRFPYSKSSWYLRYTVHSTMLSTSRACMCPDKIENACLGRVLGWPHIYRISVIPNTLVIGLGEDPPHWENKLCSYDLGVLLAARLRAAIVYENGDHYMALQLQHRSLEHTNGHLPQRHAP